MVLRDMEYDMEFNMECAVRHAMILINDGEGVDLIPAQRILNIKSGDHAQQL